MDERTRNFLDLINALVACAEPAKQQEAARLGTSIIFEYGTLTGELDAKVSMSPRLEPVLPPGTFRATLNGREQVVRARGRVGAFIRVTAVDGMSAGLIQEGSVRAEDMAAMEKALAVQEGRVAP